MKKKSNSASLSDLLSLFNEYLKPEDVMAAKAMSEASKAIINERLRLHMTQKGIC